MNKKRFILLCIVAGTIIGGCLYMNWSKKEAQVVYNVKLVDAGDAQEVNLAKFWRLRKHCERIDEPGDRRIAKVYFGETQYDGQNGYTKPKHLVAINFVDNSYYSHADDRIDSFRDPDVTLTEEDRQNIIKILETYNVLSWKSEYIDAKSRVHRMMEDITGMRECVDGGGGTWALIIQFSDNTIKFTSGNDYSNAKINPTDFDKFVEEIIQYGY